MKDPHPKILALLVCPWLEQQEALVLAEQPGEAYQQELPCLKHLLAWLVLYVELVDHRSR